MEFNDPSQQKKIEDAIKDIWKNIVQSTLTSEKPWELNFNWKDLQYQMNAARKVDAFQRYILWANKHRPTEPEHPLANDADAYDANADGSPHKRTRLLE